MSFEDCLATAVDGGELKKRDAERLKRDFDRFRASHANTDPSLAAAQAKKDLYESLSAETAHKRRKAKLALKNVQQLDADIRSHRTPAGKADIAAAAIDKLEHFGSAKFSSVAGRHKAILGMAHAKMEAMLHHFRRSRLAGDKIRKNAADLTNVLREAFGVDTGDAAAAGLAKAWKETHEWLRQRFNAAGGAIGELDNWGLPQWHDPRALRKATLKVWKEAITPLLDVKRMRHPLTGKMVAEAELDGILDEVWHNVATEGWEKREPLRQAAGRGALANQRAEHRFLVFKDPESWLQYQKDFGGGGDIFSAMMGHINMMTRDIAAMEILGPNPSGSIEWMKQAIMKEAENIAAGKPGRLGGARATNALDKARGAQKRIDAVWGSIRGALETPVSSKWANAFAAARSLITSSVLGSAALSSVSDVGTSIIARRFAGLPASNAVTDIVKGFSTYTERQAVQAGLILDAAVHVFHAQARYVGTLGGPEWASYLADRVLTLSGLTPWTQAAKHAFGLAFQVEAANHVGAALADMPDGLQRTFRRWGFTDRQWDLMRQAEIFDGHMLRPAEIAERIDPRLAERYLEMIQAETEYAVPNGSHRSRTVALSENQPGTLAGELARSVFQFKSFGAVFVLLHGMRWHGMIAGGEYASGAAYAGSLLLSTTLFGAVGLQLKQMAAGREPRDPRSLEFWGASLLQGGGLGIYGDFLFANVNRFGGGLSTTLGGPLIDRANDFWNLTAGNVIQLASGEKTHFGRELVKFARGNIPGGNIWYLKLAFERTVLDQLQFLADPEANKAFKRQQQYWQRNYGQDYFWAPGKLSPG
ncbi:hypothetical protein [Mesorhizobium sp. M1399]|uniref:hypothetical protein n=1 Tax=Mesorhizobium sp. M1399 TaxID=2957096 RepID=UPI00333570BD